MTQYNKTAFAPGTTVKVSDKFGERLGTTGIRAGALLIVTGCRKSLDGGYQVRVAQPIEFGQPDPVIEVVGEFGSDWFERDMIPFSLTKETSRAYAAKQKSRLLTPEQNTVLQSAADGEVVDVWDFHAAVTAALSAWPPRGPGSRWPVASGRASAATCSTSAAPSSPTACRGSRRSRRARALPGSRPSRTRSLD